MPHLQGAQKNWTKDWSNKQTTSEIINYWAWKPKIYILSVFEVGLLFVLVSTLSHSPLCFLLLSVTLSIIFFSVMCDMMCDDWNHIVPKPVQALLISSAVTHFLFLLLLSSWASFLPRLSRMWKGGSAAWITRVRILSQGHLGVFFFFLVLWTTSISSILSTHNLCKERCGAWEWQKIEKQIQTGEEIKDRCKSQTQTDYSVFITASEQ